MRLEPGSRLGPYEILAPLGAGGMGEVYRARDSRLGREVAIKVLPGNLVRDRERLARFEREARSASALNHPNIITIHDFSSSDGEAWLVMELVRGESLRSLLRKGAMPLKQLVNIAQSIAGGLAAAHSAGIVHRDLKPENIMIGADGTPKILDFGLVKNTPLVDADSPTELRVSQTGTLLGTAAYMSPEQARGQAVDHRSDQFSFGLILFEMATGRHPFAKATAVETVAAILNDDPEPAPETLPEALIWVIERCLARDPAGRYGSTSDLAHDLERVKSERIRPAAPVNTRAPRSKVWWLPLALFIGVAALVAVMWTPRRQAAPSEPIRVDIATPELAQVLLNETGVPVSISPDGRYLLISGIAPDGVEGFWIRDLRNGGTKLLVENGKLPAWSQDGDGIAFYADGKLKTISADGGPSRVICDARPESMPAWSGNSILFGQYSIPKWGMYRVDATGGTPQLLASAVMPGRIFSPPWWPQILPDGRIIFLRFALNSPGTIEHQVTVASSDAKNERAIARFNSRPVYTNGHLLFVRDGTLLAQPFDLKKTELTGEARPIIEGLHYFRSTGLAAFSVSRNGILVWRSATKPVRLIWVDRSGVEGTSYGTIYVGSSGRLSPDGQRYAVGVLDPKQGISDIWTFDVVGDRRERRTFSNLDEKAPIWLPDNSTVLYRSDGGGGPPDIFRLRPGDEHGQVIHSGKGVEEPHDISADGRWLLYVDYFATGTDINLLPLQPPGPSRRLLSTPFNETSPRFSPDGRWIAYQSDVSGVSEVYLRSFADPPLTRRVSSSGGSRPRWRNDGRELYYVGAGGRLMMVPINTGSPGTPRVLFQNVDIADFEPAADGSRFLMQLQEGSADTVIHMMVNWDSLLK